MSHGKEIFVVFLRLNLCQVTEKRKKSNGENFVLIRNNQVAII